MPHIIVEYTKNLENQVKIGEMLIDLHEALSECGIDKARIKTRANALEHAVVGDIGVQGAMAHATLLLLEGRDIEVKKSYGDKLHHVMHDHLGKLQDHCSVTLEVRDMIKDTYYL